MKKTKKNLCANCKYAGEQFYLGIQKERPGLPHCHCLHPEQKDFGWESLRMIFWTCDKFEKKEVAE